MSLLDHYLRAVRLYLPRRDRDDIISELSEHLESTMDERAAALGRPLTDAEQEEVLVEHGNPVVVAARYGGTNMGVSFGRQLIGPEVFPIYVRILLLDWVLVLLVVPALSRYTHVPMFSSPARFLIPMATQFVVVTLIFIAIDFLQRRAPRASGHVHFVPRHHFSFPPPYRQRIPRWQSAAGFIVLALTALWWAALPHAPGLLLGTRTRSLELTSAWDRFYSPILIALLVGVAQRGATYLHPEWNGLQFVTRLATNAFGVALIYPILRSYPYVAVAAGAPDPAWSAVAAARVNGVIWAHVLASFGLYWAITAGAHVWMCIQHLRYRTTSRRVEER